MGGTLSPDRVLRDVPANYEYYKEEWSNTYRGKFESILGQSSDETLDYICELVGVDRDSSSSLFHDITRKRSNAALLYTVHRFISGKKISVRSYGKREGSRIVEGTEYKYVLEKLADGDLDILYEISLFHEWMRASDVYKYGLQGEDSLPDDYKDIIKDKKENLRIRLKRRTKSRAISHDERDQLVFEDSILVAFNRQTSDRASRDIVGRQRRRNLQSVFVEVDEGEQIIRIGTKNTHIREQLRLILQNIFNTYLIDLETDVDKKDVDKDEFREELLREIEESSSTRVLAASFRRTDTDPTLPISVSKKSYNRDIRPVLRELDSGVVPVQLDNLDKMTVAVEECEARINAEQSIEQTFYRLDSDIDTQLRRRKEEFRDNFHAAFGVPVDKKIPLHWVTGERQSFISAILKNPTSYDSRKFPNQDLAKRLADELGVISLIKRTQYKCVGCGNRYNGSIDECNSCGDDVRKIAEYNVPRVSKAGIRSQIKEIAESEGITYIGSRTERIYQTKYNFIQVRYEGYDFDLLLNNSEIKLTEKAVEHMKKSLNPVLIINPGNIKGKKLMDEALTATLDLAELVDYKLDDELPDKYIREKLLKLQRTVEERAATNARDAYEKLEEMVESPGDFRGEQFEQEIFHIFNQIISNTEQWGSKRKGNVPDGFAELYFPTGQGDYYKSFAYDAKFTESTELSLSTDESVRTRDYVKRINESGEVTGTEVDLSHFIIISNAEPGSMNVLAGKLNRMRSWDGYPVFMDIEFVLGLHIAYNENSNIIRKYWSKFSKEFYKTLNGDKLYQTDLDEEEFIELRGGDVESMMGRFEDSISGEPIEIGPLREFLEKDIMP